MPIVRKPELDDLGQIKYIADSNRDSLGFVIVGEFAFSIERNWMFVIDLDSSICGFINYRHRMDNLTTVYQICIENLNRRKGYGSLLMEKLFCESRKLGKNKVRLKSPISNTSNEFYEKIGFEIASTEKRKGNLILTWEYKLDQSR